MQSHVTLSFGLLVLAGLGALAVQAGPMPPKVLPPSAEAVVLSPDHKFALIGYRYTGEDERPLLRLFEVSTGKEVKSFPGHRRAVDYVAFTPDGKRAVSGGWDGTYRVWDLATGKEVHQFEADADPGSVAALSPDGKLLLAYLYKSGWKTAEVRGWDITTGKLERIFTAFEVLRDPVPAVLHPPMAFSPDGKQVQVGFRLIDAKTGEMLQKFGSSRPRVGNFHSFGSVQVRIFRRKYSSSRKP